MRRVLAVALAASTALAACTSIEGHRAICAQSIPTIVTSVTGPNATAGSMKADEPTTIMRAAPDPAAVEQCAQLRAAQERDQVAAGIVLGIGAAALGAAAGASYSRPYYHRPARVYIVR